MSECLPDGWVTATLSEIAEINPAAIRHIEDDFTLVNFIPMRAVAAEGGGVSAPEVRKFGEVKRGYTSFVSGDVITAKITPCMENGKTTAVPTLPHEACFGSTEFHVVRPELGIPAGWVAHFLLQHSTRRDAQRQMTGAVGQMRVPSSFLEELRLPVAPLMEQKRICDALDELLSDLGSGVEALKSAKTKLEHYRASVLKAAVEGELTAEWRKAHPNAEPASVLLQRILKERRRKWEQEQLRKLKEQGKKPPANWKAKYKEPVAPDTSKLPSLPDGWCWALIGQLCEVGTGATPHRSRRERYYQGGTVAWVTSSCVNEPFVDAASELVTKHALEECNLSLYRPGTVLLAMYGEGKTRGKHTELRIAATTNQAIAALKLPESVRQYVQVSLSKNYHDIRRAASGGVQPNLNLDLVRSIAVPLPPSDEQEVTWSAVEEQLSQIASVSTEIDRHLLHSNGLRQVILRDAFAGKLVPQNPTDEPASELLKRIAAERAARAKKAKAKKRGMKQMRKPAQRGRQLQLA